MTVNIIVHQQEVGIRGNKNYLPYYTNCPWAENDEFFIFFSESSRNNQTSLCAFFPQDSRTEILFPLNLDMVEDDTRREDGFLSSTLLVHSGKIVVPCKNRLYRFDLASGARELLFESPEDTKIGGVLTISLDEQYVCGGIYHEQNSAAQSNIVFVWSLTESRFVYHENYNILANHFQFYPDGENILFAHEGPTETIDDRLNILNWRSGTRRCIYRHQRDQAGKLIEYIGHEQIAGNKVAAVRYPVSPIDFGLLLVDPNTETAELVMQDDCWHCGADGRGRRLVSDTMWWGRSSRTRKFAFDIILYDVETHRKYLLYSINNNPLRQVFHPHPQLNLAGDKVLSAGNNDIDGKTQAVNIIFTQLEP